MRKYLLILFVITLFSGVFTLMSCNKSEPEIMNEADGLKFIPYQEDYAVQWDGNTELNENLEIPEYFDGHKVVAIYENGFENCSKLIRVSIPESIKKINRGAFRGCTRLTEVKFSKPDYYSTTEIADGTFEDCIALNSITIPRNIRVIGKNAFKNCISLDNIYRGDNVETIGENAFLDCKKLRNINFPNIQIIKNSAFYGCLNLRKVVGDYVIEIGKSAFYGCEKFEGFESLKGVDPTGWKMELGASAFFGCKSLKNFSFQKEVTTLPSKVFMGCTALQDIIIPESIKKIGNYAFADCFNLIGVEIKNGVEEIDDFAFSNCTSLIEIEIPQSVIYLGESVFENCGDLINCILPQTIQLSRNVFRNSGIYNDISNWDEGVLYICKHLIKAKNDILGSYAIQNGTLSMAEEAFFDCKDLTEIVFSNYVKIERISEKAFYNCNKLKKVTISNCVKVIMPYAFGQCSMLEEAFFENASAWYISKNGNYTKLTNAISNSSTAAIYLKQFYDYRWNRAQA